MSTSTVLAVNLLDAHSLLQSFGASGVLVVLLLETGILIGQFLPGGSLQYTAGPLATTRAGSGLHLSLPAVLVAAAGGAQRGYVIGRRAGPALVHGPQRRRLAAGVARTGDYLQEYERAKAVVLARFIPVVRTVINPVAGITGIDARTFKTAPVAGGLVWSLGVTLAGYALGSHIPNIDHYLLPIVAVVDVLSLVPIGVELASHRRCEVRR